MSMVRAHMLKVGPFVFSAGTAAYQSMERTDNWRWVTQERVGNELANQYMGPGERTINLDGIVYTLYDVGAAPFNPMAVVGTEQIDKLRKAGDAGVPMMVTDGRGRSFGRWVMTSLKQVDEEFLDNGAAKVQTFNMSLRFYGAKSNFGVSVNGVLNNVFSSITGMTGAVIGTAITTSADILSDMRAAGAIE